ncbi:MAG: hypothetical protein HC799_18605, partial [Limnothrix sp. RL_2_0]|nr:hypothetical protein [Limnothrix sp. RL_2_0]
MTRVLNLLGARLPQNLLPEQKDNETGFWESRDLMVLHNEILQSAGSMWDDWRRFNRQWFNSLEAEHYRKTLTDFLVKDFGDYPLFVIKDPRISRLLPLWIQVLEECGVTPLGVIPVRNPLEVASSLKKRNGFMIAKSCLVWLRYMLEAERGSRGLRRCIVTYDALLANWRQVADTIAEQSSLVWPRQSAAATVEIEAFLSMRHRHHSRRAEDLDAYPEVAEWVRRTYRVLLEMTHPQAAMICCEKLDAIYDEFDKASGVFEAVLLAEQRAAQESAEKKIVAKETLLREKTEAQLQEIQRLKGELSASHTKVQRLTGELSNNRSEAQRLRSELLASEAKVQHLTGELSRSRAEAQRLEGELSDNRSRTQHLEQELSVTQSNKQKLEGELSNSRSKTKQLEGELSNSRMTAQHLGGELSAQRGETDQLRNELKTIKSSMIWRATGWLRKGSSWLPHWKQDLEFVFKLLRWSVALRLPTELASWRRLRIEYQLIDESEVFDRVWYLAQNADLAATKKDPLGHYLRTGVAEGRNPNPLFDNNWYLNQNPDVAETGINPLVHYLTNGAAEGRDPNPLFDTDWYLNQNSDVVESGLNPLVHYLRFGAAEGRNPNPLFDTAWYLNQNLDVAEVGVNSLLHYLRSGTLEGRDPNPLFDTAWYLEQNPDVAASRVNPLAHYLSAGAAEGRNPNPLFDTGWYLNRNRTSRHRESTPWP